MKINPEVGLMNPKRNCTSSMYPVCFFHLLSNNKFMLLTRKHKHITLHSFYLQYLNMWQSPRKQHNSQFDVHNHKDKRMVGNEPSSLWYPCTAQREHSSCEAKDTNQTLHPPLSCSDWMPWCVITFTIQQYINCSLLRESFHSHSLVAALLKSFENWSCYIEWVDPRITVPSRVWSSSHTSLSLKVNQEIPANWCSITLQTTSILLGGLLTDLLWILNSRFRAS